MTALIPSRNLALAAAVLLAFGLSGCMGGRMTYGTGVTPGKQTISDLTSIVTLSGDEKAAIDYEPRAGIVAPPSTAALPPPAAGNPASPTGDWPRDPDELRRARLAALGKEGDPSAGRLIPLSALPPAKHPEEGNSKYQGDPLAYDPVKAREIRKLRADAKASLMGGRDAEGNLVRRTLTEPPVVYREPDPTAPTEFTEKKKKKKWWRPWS